LTTAELERYKAALGKSKQAKRRLSKTPNGDYMFIVGIGREINGDNIVITYYKNKLGGRATDAKPQSADAIQDTIGNGDRHIPNKVIIPQNDKNVNQDQIQGEQMNLQEQIKAEKSIYKKALLIIELQKQEQANDTLSNSYKDCRVNKLLDKSYQL